MGNVRPNLDAFCNYGVAQGSLECYLRSTNYIFKRIDLDEDNRANKYCVQYKQLFFRKHCIASAYLPDTDWMLVLDAVVNPNHCIEEVKNTLFARKFLLDWANMEFSQPEFSSTDNGALQLHILKTVLPNAQIEINACTKYWQRSEDYDSLMAYTTCVRSALGARRIWPPKLRILRRAHGFCRDWFISSDGWAENDFMFHGWKAHNLSGEWKSPFEKVPNASECTGGYLGWHWRPDTRISVDEVRSLLAETEKSSAADFPQKARIHAHLTEPEVGECYPNCDEQI
uniref:Uncharacterized protein n=1 Tax=Globodera rostochiensis TaxID=31243 RepID=A0A914HPK4_GLORO